ncbi:MAG: hypothetical protein NC453_10610 [Muribaculum sp.]|nr:hypothetical protein [Muribaculum sp.]
MFSTQSGVNKMSECLPDDNAMMMVGTCSKLVVAKCQHSQIFDSEKEVKNKPSNHVSNHDGAFVICVISNCYKGVFGSANHVSNHDKAILKPFLVQVTTQVTTGDSLVICVIPITYKSENLRGNHVSNHDSPKIGGSKMIATTQVTTIEVLVMFETSTLYSGSKMSANHASNHGATPKLLPEKTYSSILYLYNIFIINNIILGEKTRTRTYVRTHVYAYARA